MIKPTLLALALVLSPQTRTQPVPAFEGLAIWNTKWASISMLDGFWAPTHTDSGQLRLRSEQEWGAVGMMSRASLHEVSYRLPKGSEIVFEQGWIFISGPRFRETKEGPVPAPLLVPTGPSPLAKMTSMARNEGVDELHAQVSGKHIEVIELHKSADWAFVEPGFQFGEANGWELYNAAALDGEVVGKFRGTLTIQKEIVASGAGLRLHCDDVWKEPWLTLNPKEMPKAVPVEASAKGDD